MRLIKRRLRTLVIGLLGVGLTFVGLAVPSGVARASTTINFLVTLYGWPDNSPPGDAIAYPEDEGYPTIHNVASGVGTYSNPITFATDQAELPIGTIVYYPYLHRYFIMEDDCTECDEDWTGQGPDGGPGLYHIDLWIGGENGNANDVINCEDNLTQNSAPVIVDPPGNEPVDTTPLFNSSTNTCYNPSSFNGGGTAGTITGNNSGLCLGVTGDSTTPKSTADIATCDGDSEQGWTVNSDGTIVNGSGLCLSVSGGATAPTSNADVYTCNGSASEYWTVNSDGTITGNNSGLCLSVHGGATASGSGADIYTCNSSVSEYWTINSS
jgi:Ricin-type beta-trefoil lectin domain